MHRGMQRATTFYSGGAKLTFFIDSFLIFLFALSSSVFFVLTDAERSRINTFFGGSDLEAEKNFIKAITQFEYFILRDGHQLEGSNSRSRFISEDIPRTHNDLSHSRLINFN